MSLALSRSVINVEPGLGLAAMQQQIHYPRARQREAQPLNPSTLNPSTPQPLNEKQMKKLLSIIAIAGLLMACNDKPAAQVGETVEVQVGDSTVKAVVVDPASTTSVTKFQPTGDLEKDAEFVVVNSLKVTADMLEGKATQADQDAASQMLLDAMKYYQDLDQAKGEQFRQIVNKKLLEHANEFKKK
ncbi:MAG: hypothetical protein IJU62_01440 [Muribaculaceae bacterium]|nr:hypothetical protein [Muribaculaceae bacterium]